ncbi:MAG: ABC transporter substrate-binding protein [Clostridiales bacterium]|jgi:NitT/TauT family transport system substrate-binding protein|nr:ABC transporter substrate-binding protein [Eubacteriales bacterium]MDH7567834.1 ABC transporter substrate-binding protein [Clostridiales bacterium]
MRKIKIIVITAVITVLVLGLSACQNADGKTASGTNTEKQTVKVAYLPITHALPLYVENEIEKAKFNNINVELVKFGSWPELMDALNTGKVDGASVLIELAMKAKEQGIDLKAVALGHRDGNAVVASQDISKTADLKGKTFAIPSKLSTHNILLYQMLKNAGLKLTDLNVVELPPAEMPAALSEGRVSGYIVAEPFGAKSVANGKGKVLYQAEDIWKNSVCCGLVLRNDFIKNKSEAARELVKEYVEAGKYIDSNGEKVNDVAKKYMNVEQNVLDLSLKWVSYKDLRLNENDYNDLRKYLIEMDLSKNPPSYKDFVDNSLFDKVK